MVGEILSGVGSLIGAGTGIYNSIQSHKYNKEVLEYQKNLQNKIFEREDSAVQRRAADLEKAGMSKWLAAGQGASSGAVVPFGTSGPPQVDFQGAILGLNNLAEMFYNKEKIVAETNNLNANSSKTRAEILTELERTKNVIEERKNTSASTQKLLKEIESLEQNITESQQRIIESQSRTDLNDILTNEKGYNLLLSSLMSRRTNDPQEKKKLFELARLVGGLLGGSAETGIPKVVVPKKRY